MNKFLQYIALCILGVLISSGVSGFVIADTIKLYFDTDKAEFNGQSRYALDSLFYNDLIVPGQTISILGYTDYVGNGAYNEKLSKARAQYVADYFAGMGVHRDRIKQLIGKGEIDRILEKKGGYQSDRRVDVIMELAGAKKQGGNKVAINTIQSTLQKPIDVPAGQTFVLEKIYFFAGRHVVKPESLAELDKLYNALAANEKLTIQIEGHVCCVRNAPDALDEDTHELALSTNRAKYIYQYLIEKGIDEKRLRYRGFGRTRPVVIRELSAEDEDRNRRVEVRVLSR